LYKKLPKECDSHFVQPVVTYGLPAHHKTYDITRQCRAKHTYVKQTSILVSQQKTIHCQRAPTRTVPLTGELKHKMFIFQCNVAKTPVGSSGSYHDLIHGSACPVAPRTVTSYTAIKRNFFFEKYVLRSTVLPHFEY